MNIRQIEDEEWISEQKEEYREDTIDVSTVSIGDKVYMQSPMVDIQWIETPWSGGDLTDASMDVNISGVSLTQMQADMLAAMRDYVQAPREWPQP